MEAVIGLGIRYSDEHVRALSAANPGWQFERSDDGALLVSPTSTKSGRKSGKAYALLLAYQQRVGGEVFDSSTGFLTPAGGVVSPDASWMSSERAAPHAENEGFWPAIPDVVIEVASASDAWPNVCAKIDKYIADHALYAIAIDPKTRAIYERGSAPAGLTLDTDAIIDA